MSLALTFIGSSLHLHITIDHGLNIRWRDLIQAKPHPAQTTSIQRLHKKQYLNPLGYRINNLPPPLLPLARFHSLQEESSNGTHTGKRTADLEAGSSASELGVRSTGSATAGGSSAGSDGHGADGRRIGNHGNAGAAHDGGGG